MYKYKIYQKNNFIPENNIKKSVAVTPYITFLFHILYFVCKNSIGY